MKLKDLIGADSKPKLFSTDETGRRPSAFRHGGAPGRLPGSKLAATPIFGREYDIFEEDGEKVGQQYPTDTRAG
ncbi:MAG: hypothetical protein MZU95_13365 [Desulfomicrobium escambiense]|nr:hypothetical protein [Desulfomicrobium escambiense]